MTADEHERYYAERSGKTIDTIRKAGGYSVHCDCDSMGCPGRSMVFAQRPAEWLEAIQRHVERGREWLKEMREENEGATLSDRWFRVLVAIVEGSKHAKDLPPADPNDP